MRWSKFSTTPVHLAIDAIPRALATSAITAKSTANGREWTRIDDWEIVSFLKDDFFPLQFWILEIEDYAGFKPGYFKIVWYLANMLHHDPIACFDFDDEPVFNLQIGDVIINMLFQSIRVHSRSFAVLLQNIR
jgi:hypothetical protein